MIKDVEKIENVVMEVSSHALEQNRVGGCRFKGAVLTNLTQDHLDYHITMDNYFAAKAMLFQSLEKSIYPNVDSIDEIAPSEIPFAVINADDLYAERFLNATSNVIRKFTYGVKKQADFMAKDIKFSLNGAEFTLCTPEKEYKVSLNLNGMFSVYNVLASFTAAYAMGISI